MKNYFSGSLFRYLRICTLSGILFLIAAAFINSGRVNGSGKKGMAPVEKRYTAKLLSDTSMVTIESINEENDGKTIAFRFFEKEATYTIAKTDKNFVSNRELLAAALKNNFPVKIIPGRTGNTIMAFIKATDAEIRAYNYGEGFNSEKMKLKGAEAVSVDVSKIDTSIFDYVEAQRQFPVFRLCNNVVPDYATLVALFDYCANQGCNKMPPYAITNCIPFQFVKDGCYARAHKMRQMIMKKYGYCVEKVFSFATPYPNTLAVKANLWGGCCVEWWYHVVPLLRLNVQRKTAKQLCYVIDPGMFTKPVLLSTWLQAQKNTTCNANATVTSYSIQPGSAYTPMNYGASFSTDPNYTATEQTLIGYKNGVTCN